MSRMFAGTMPGVGAWLVWFLHGLYLMVSYWQSSVIAEYYLRLNDLCLFRPTEVQISLWTVHIYPHSQSLTLQNSFLTIIKLVGTAPGEMQQMIFCSLINLKDLCWSTLGRNSVWSPFILMLVSLMPHTLVVQQDDNHEMATIIKWRWATTH